jgi:hypothetical protein
MRKYGSDMKEKRAMEAKAEEPSNPGFDTSSNCPALYMYLMRCT